MVSKNPRLAALMDELMKELHDQVKNGVATVTEDGEVLRGSTPAAVLNVARQFLKDNNVEVPSENERLKALVADLPFADPPGTTLAH